MRPILWKYLAQFKKLYPTHPSPETWDLYERVLSDVSDMDLAAACEICMGELTYFPMPAQIRERLREPEFVVTTEPPIPEEQTITAEDLAEINKQFTELTKKLSIDVALKKERRGDPKTFAWNGISFTITCDPTLRHPGQSLIAWARRQDLSENFPRTSQEIDFIKIVKEYDKPKRKRGRLYGQRAI
jgi:hypothetical protein